ncbi:hypothetical protein GF336_06730 [Candidatus Woesearchaeota archaeon]|nr:hypothetical protein [Candidatus Woesearchaeota archaeon]
MRLSRYILGFVLLSALFITGCGEDGETTTAESPYTGGNKGIVAEFEPFGIVEDGVYTIYRDETFPIQILLKNKGEEDISPGDIEVELKGIFLGDFSGITAEELSNDDEVEGISDVNPDGGEEIINFGSDVQYTPEIKGDFVPLDILATYTYRYKTKTSVPKACFVEDFRDTDFCDVDEKKTAYSSAAPIQVESVTEQPAGAGRVSLAFDITNVGGGSATLPGEEFNTRYDQISYKIVPSTEADRWECTAAGREDSARFSGGEARIICKLEESLEEGDKYTKEIVLEIDYDYRDVIQESLRVRSVVE